MKEVIYIPLGTRCSSSSIIDGYFKKRKFALPFDWIDIPIEALKKFFHIENIDSFCDSYFNLDNISHQRSRMDNAWFPHHLLDGNNVEGEVLLLKDKFSRRLKRMYDVLNSDAHLIFLTTWGHVSNQDPAYFELIESINSIIKNKATFISVNLLDVDVILTRCINFHVPLTTWEQYDIEVARKLREHEMTKPYFQ